MGHHRRCAHPSWPTHNTASHVDVASALIQEPEVFSSLCFHHSQMVFKADSRLYAAKHLGKNMVVSADCEVPEEN